MEEGSYIHILRALQSLPRLYFVDLSFNFIPGRYATSHVYKWYSADGWGKSDLILGAENGRGMAEELEMVIKWQLEVGEEEETLKYGA